MIHDYLSFCLQLKIMYLRVFFGGTRVCGGSKGHQKEAKGLEIPLS